MNRVFSMLPKQVQFALILMLIVVLTQLLGQAGTTLVDWARKGGREVTVTDGVFEFLVAAVCVGVTYWMGQAWSRPSRWVAAIRAGVAAVAVVSSNTFLNTVGAIVGGLVGESGLRWLLLLVLLMALWGWAALVCMPRIQRWFQAQVDRGITGEAKYGPGHVVLVMLVSAVKKDSIAMEEGRAEAVVRMQDDKTCEPIIRQLAFQDLKSDIITLNGTRWPWQHMLRGIEPVVARMKPGDRTTILLVGSIGERGSFQQLPTCMEFLKRYPQLRDASKVTVESSAAFLERPSVQTGLRLNDELVGRDGIDFENFNAVCRHVLAVVHAASRMVGDERVFVDVTGGQKTTSIAAAVATTGETGFCQYVQANHPHKVVFYDLHPPELPSI